MGTFERIVFDSETGVAAFPGVVMPRDTRVVMRQADMLAVKVPGGSYTSDRISGSRYAPGYFLILEILGLTGAAIVKQLTSVYGEDYGEPDEDGRVTFHVRERMRFPLRP